MDNKFKPQRELRSDVLKNALKTYIVSPLCKSYQACAVRALWNEETSALDIWKQRKTLENKLFSMEKVVAFVSSFTAIESKSGKKKRKSTENLESDESNEESSGNEKSTVTLGLAFWIVFDWPECVQDNFLEMISKEFMEAKLGIESCRAVKGRGRY